MKSLWNGNNFAPILLCSLFHFFFCFYCGNTWRIVRIVLRAKCRVPRVRRVYLLRSGWPAVESSATSGRWRVRTGSWKKQPKSIGTTRRVNWAPFDMPWIKEFLERSRRTKQYTSKSSFRGYTRTWIIYCCLLTAKCFAYVGLELMAWKIRTF